MVIISNSIFIKCRGTGRLDAANDAQLGEQAQSIINRLPGDRADLSANSLSNNISGAVRLGCHRPNHRQSLGGNLNTVLAK